MMPRDDKKPEVRLGNPAPPSGEPSAAKLFHPPGEGDRHRKGKDRIAMVRIREI